MPRNQFRRHSNEFKLQVCSEVRTGAISSREAQRRYDLSSSLLGLWLARYDRGEIEMHPVDPALIVQYEAKIAALERKVGQLTMEIDLLNKNKLQRRASSSDKSSVVSGPKAAPSDGGAT